MRISRRGLIGTAASAAALLGAARPVAHRAQSLKIGVLTDQSGPYQDLAGPTSVKARAAGASRISACRQGLQRRGHARPTIRTSPISAPASPGSGTTSGVDVIFEVANSAVALAVAGVAQGEEQGLHQLRRGHLAT